MSVNLDRMAKGYLPEKVRFEYTSEVSKSSPFEYRREEGMANMKVIVYLSSSKNSKEGRAYGVSKVNISGR